MTFKILPYKMNATELNARVGGDVRLRPDDIVRFEDTFPVYGQVLGVRTLSESHGDGFVVKFRILLGSPHPDLTEATVLASQEMAGEVRQMQEPPELAMHFGDAFTADYYRLGPLTVIEGPDFILKFETLMMFVEAVSAAGRKALVIDPLGLFGPGERVSWQQAGEHIRLSMQGVGSKRFLSAFAHTFPAELREQSLQYLVNNLPMASSFVAFRDFKNWDPLTDHPLRNLVLESLESAAREHVFADAPDEVFNLSRLTPNAVNVADLSSLDEPWKALFYEEILRALLQNPAKDVVPVLIYPENYLESIERWIQKADEAEMSLITLASPYPPEIMTDMANNGVVAESHTAIHMEGTLTSGLPLTIPLQESDLVRQQPPVKPAVLTQAHLIDEATPIYTLMPEPPTAGGLPASELMAAELVTREFVIPHEQSVQNPEIPWQPESAFGDLPGSEAAEQFHADMGYMSSAQPMPGAQPERPVSAFEPEFAALNLPEAAPPVPESGQTGYTEPLMGPETPEPEQIAALAEDAKTEQQKAADGSYYDSILGGSEFNFDLNLDEAGEEPPEAEPARSMDQLPEGIAQSLTEFEQPPRADVGITLPDLGQFREEAPEEPQLQRLEQLQPVHPPDEADYPSDAEITVEAEPAAEDEPAFGVETFQSEGWQPVEPQPEEEILPVIQKPATETPAANGSGAFRAGDRVRHETYGLGTISKVIPMDENVILNINFENGGKRLLDPRLCNLERA